MYVQKNDKHVCQHVSNNGTPTIYQLTLEKAFDKCSVAWNTNMYVKVIMAKL